MKLGSLWKVRWLGKGRSPLAGERVSERSLLAKMERQIT